MFPQAIDYVTKSPVPDMANLPSSCWSGWLKRLPKTIQIVVVILGCLPEIRGKSLLLKTAYPTDTGLGETELQLMGRPPLCRLLLIVSESALQASRKKINQ